MVAFDYLRDIERPATGGHSATPHPGRAPGSARSTPLKPASTASWARPRRPNSRARFRRLLLLLALAAGAGALASSVASRLIASASPSHAGPSPCPGVVSGPSGNGCTTTTYIARPGDTLWAVAVRFSGAKDPRPLEYLLESQIGGGTLQPGEVLHVP